MRASKGSEGGSKGAVDVVIMSSCSRCIYSTGVSGKQPSSNGIGES